MVMTAIPIIFKQPNTIDLAISSPMSPIVLIFSVCIRCSDFSFGPA